MPTTLSPAIKEKLDSVKKRLKTITEDLEPQIKANEGGVADLKEKVAKMSKDNATDLDAVKDLAKEAQDRIDELETKAKEGGFGSGAGTPDAVKGLGQAFREQGAESSIQTPGRSFRKSLDAGYQQVRRLGRVARAAAKAGVDMKAITNAGGSGGPLINPDRQDQIIGLAERAPRIVDLLDTLPISTDTFEYERELSTTDNAAPQAGQDALLGESDITFELVTGTIETVGTFLRASMQILDDTPRLEAFVRQKLTRKLDLEVEDQVLLGDGTGNNLSGLVPNATDYDTADESVLVPDGSGGTDATDLDKIRIAMMQIMEDEYTPTGIVLPAFNWASIELTKTTEGAYVFVNPQNQTAPRLWGLPVVPTNAMPVGESLVGDFQTAATFYDREQTGVEASTEDSDNFRKLMVTMRIYARVGVAVELPDAMRHISTLSTRP
jgi:HK97 family phage major capsid protein